MKNILYVLIGRSCVGKTTLLQYAVDKYGLHNVISHTTRKQRLNETPFIDYIFVDKYEFLQMLAENKFIEHTKYSGNLYGLSVYSFDTINNDNITIVEPNGLKHLKNSNFITNNFNIVVIKIEESDDVIMSRFIYRGDSIETIKNRIDIDTQLFKDIKYDILINSRLTQLDKIINGGNEIK